MSHTLAIIIVGGVIAVGAVLFLSGGGINGIASKFAPQSGGSVYPQINPSTSVPNELGFPLQASPTAMGSNINVTENIQYSPSSDVSTTTNTSSTLFSDYQSTNNQTNIPVQVSTKLGLFNSGA